MHDEAYVKMDLVHFDLNTYLQLCKSGTEVFPGAAPGGKLVCAPPVSWRPRRPLGHVPRTAPLDPYVLIYRDLMYSLQVLNKDRGAPELAGSRPNFHGFTFSR